MVSVKEFSTKIISNHSKLFFVNFKFQTLTLDLAKSH